MKTKKMPAPKRAGTQKLLGRVRAAQLLDLVGGDADALRLLTEIARFIVRRDRDRRRAR